MAVASMVLGIVSLVLFCVWYISIPCAIIGLVLGFVAKGKANRGEGGGGGMAIAGIVCSIIAIVLVVLLIAGALSFISYLNQHPNAMQKFIPQTIPASGSPPPSATPTGR